MVGQRVVVVRVAGSRRPGVPEGPAERAGRPATGKVGPPPVAMVPVVLVPVVRVKAHGLAAVVLREPPRDLRRGLRRPTGRAGRAARLPPKDLAGPATLAARHRVTSCAAARPLTAGHARAGTLREPLPMVMSGAAAGGPRPVVSSEARAGPRPRVSSAAARGPRRATDPGRPSRTPRAALPGARLGNRRAAYPVTGPGPRGRTGPGRRARGTANVTAAGRQIATSAVMTAVRLRVVVVAVRTARTAPQRATGPVASAAGMAPHKTAASVLTTGALPVTGGPPVTGSPPVTGVRDGILPLIGRPGLPAVGPGTARHGATLAVTAPRRRPVDVTESATRPARRPGGREPARGRETAPEAR